MNAIKLNSQFENLLGQFEYKKQYREQLKLRITEKLKSKFDNELRDVVLVKKRITELENQLEKLEERYALGSLKEYLYEKFVLKFNDELSKLKEELSGDSFDRSNLNLTIEKGMAIAEKLSQLWVSSDLSGKQRLQYLVFPKGILYNKEKGTYRTEKINSLFVEIPPLVRV